MGSTGLNVPAGNAEELLPQYRALHRAISEGLISSCHAVSRGGLAVHLAMSSMAGELGMEISLAPIPAANGLTASQILYSESCGRFVITLSPDKKERFEGIFSGMKKGLIGSVTEKSCFSVKDSNGQTIIDEDIGELKESWKKPFGDLI
jgi:phosphoribosylformylglycinamidine (FGAM) synthase-like enzyme